MLTERERIEKVMAEEQLTAKQFAEEIGVSPGTLSNITNGRNNPSLDVMRKVLERFSNISGDWLLLGTGEMYKTTNVLPTTPRSLFGDDLASTPDTVHTTPAAPSSPPPPTGHPASLPISTAPLASSVPMGTSAMPTVPPTAAPENTQPIISQIVTTPEKNIDKIMVFFSDGTFQIFTPEK